MRVFYAQRTSMCVALRHERRSYSREIITAKSWTSHRRRSVRWSLRPRPEGAGATGNAVGPSPLDASIRRGATAEERVAIGAALVAAHAGRPNTCATSVDDLFPDEEGVPEVRARYL